MAGFGNESKQTSTERRPAGACVIQNTPSGLRILKTSEGTAKSLEKAILENQPQRVSKYFDAAFNQQAPGETEAKEIRLRQFMKVYNATNCFYCEDRGYHIAELEAPNGAKYNFAFACICEKAVNSGSVLELVNAGVKTLVCELGGQGGKYCPFEQRQSKCHTVNCPKFN